MSLSTMTSILSNPLRMVFVDSSAFLAQVNVLDQFHGKSRETWLDLLQRDVRLVCNNYVLLESIAIMQSRHGLDVLCRFQNQMMPHINVQWLTESEHTDTMLTILSANRRRLSLVDCSAFATMRRLGIRTAFTFDTHFAEQGFEVIPEEGNKVIG